MPLSRVLARLARQGTLLARKLGKEVDFVVRPSALRVDGERYAPVFSSMTHVIRNALDHGIEDADERLATGKPARGGIVLSAASRAERGEIVVAVADDGPGIDWERVRAKAAAAGLPAATEQDLVDALFSDGFSTRDEASELSGRGVGLSAVRAAAEALGGAVRVRSVPHHGSTVEILLPDDAETAPVRAKPAA